MRQGHSLNDTLSAVSQTLLLCITSLELSARNYRAISQAIIIDEMENYKTNKKNYLKTKRLQEDITKIFSTIKHHINLKSVIHYGDNIN